MKTVYALMTNTFGEPRLFGVYKDAKGASLAFEHLSMNADPNDEFRIKHAVVEEYADVLESKVQCDKNRAEAMADVSN